MIRSLLFDKNIEADISSLEDEEIYTFYMEGTVNSDVEMLRKLFERII